MRQVALVTGSSRGIGLATAEALAQEGFAIALNGPADDDELRAAHTKIKALGVPVVSAPFDVSDLAQHATHLDKIEADGSRETLDCTAGFAPGRRVNLEKALRAGHAVFIQRFGFLRHGPPQHQQLADVLDRRGIEYLRQRVQDGFALGAVV